LEHDSEIGVGVLHNLETGGLADINVAMPGVDACDVLFEGELAHLFQRVRTH